ncbi:MAG: hypothetical protein LUQ28_12970 [Methylococcaceae bacterium]|nr:hypothetical protein [Methylococcaceae bacterium]
MIPHDEVSWGIGAIQYWHYTPFAKVLMEMYGVKTLHSLAINIECCYDDPSGEFPVEVVNNLNYLWKQLIIFYPTLQSNRGWALCRHWDITGKECPKYYIGRNREWEDLKIDICKRD